MSQLELNLNFNYGKRAVGSIGTHGEAVAVDTENGMRHFKFNGFLHGIELPLMERHYGTDSVKCLTFFGSSGYRFNEDDSWRFCAGSERLVAIVVNDRVYCLLNSDGTPKLTKSVVERLESSNNVVSIFSKIKSPLK